MPNTRDPKKKMLGFWLSPEEIAQIDELARRNNTNRAEIIRALVRNQLAPLQKLPSPTSN